MNLASTVAVVVAGFLAGAVNAVVGGGSLITFPVLLAVGFGSLTANISNNVALVVGNVSATVGTRAGLAGQSGLVRRLLPVSAAGGIAGALLLLALPAAAFHRVVPVLVALGVALIIVQPWLAARLGSRGAGHPLRAALLPSVGVAGVYGGYFGAAQGVLLIAVLALAAAVPLGAANAVKNLLTLAVNACAAVVFAVAQPNRIDPGAVTAVALGAVLGGAFGARLARRLPPAGLRAVVVIAGVAAVARLALTSA